MRAISKFKSKTSKYIYTDVWLITCFRCNNQPKSCGQIESLESTCISLHHVVRATMLHANNGNTVAHLPPPSLRSLNECSEVTLRVQAVVILPHIDYVSAIWSACVNKYILYNKCCLRAFLLSYLQQIGVFCLKHLLM